MDFRFGGDGGRDRLLFLEKEEAEEGEGILLEAFWRRGEELDWDLSEHLGRYF
eukprot:CAMPEP_0182513738 /NCGR_PEP_ID=MMETSP1321-20130603/34522_1 /TAXON_ID=91990 /ORGANISM="Bolidomonas sp., Strain RCC1657" /LENGTH=52 /DNA_ID=CAMNT_0024720805 /DNA_START=192 /DNA_END=350 /DNA_ORIENTATION=+